MDEKYKNVDTSDWSSANGQKYLKDIESAWKKSYKMSIDEASKKYELLSEDTLKNINDNYMDLPLYQFGSVSSYIEDKK